MGSGPWMMMPMWGFWWIFPAIGLLILFFVVIAVLCLISSGGHFMCMGSHQHDAQETAQLRRELEELREQVKKQASA